MANGLTNLIGTGEAQILPQGQSANAFVQQLNQQKQQRDQLDLQNKRYDQQEQDKKEKDLYGILGDAFNPKNFNAVIQDKVRQAKTGLAGKLKGGGMAFGDVYMEAQQIAGELGLASDKFNKLDAQFTATRTEYEKYDKGLNTSGIEYEARKNAYKDYLSGKLDENKNYYDDALSNMTSGAFTGSSTVVPNYIPEETQSLTGKFKKRDASGRTREFNWDSKVQPAIYDIQDKGNLQEPAIITKGEPSGIKDANGKEVPMLTESAYKRWIMLPSDRKKYDDRITKQYGNIPLNSEQADILRRVEAYKDAETYKPKVNAKEADIYRSPQSSNTTNYYGEKPVRPINLNEYTFDLTKGGRNITELMQGVKVTGLPSGGSLLAESVYYNPVTGKVTFKEYTTRDEDQKFVSGKPRTLSLQTFMQNIKTNNPGADLTFLRGLENAIGDNPKQPTDKGMVTMILPDGRKGQIPESAVAQFLKDNPKAKKQ